MLGCHVDDFNQTDDVCSGTPEIQNVTSFEECCDNNGTTFLRDDGICMSCNGECTISLTVYQLQYLDKVIFNLLAGGLYKNKIIYV